MANSDKNIRITTSRNKATLPSIVFTGSSAGTSVLTLEVRDDNSIAFTGLDGDVFALDYDLSSGTIWSVNDKTGVPFLRTSFNGLIGIAEFGGTVGIGQTNPLYKLDVKGNVGFASTNDNSYSILIDNVSAAGSNSLQLRAANDLRFYNTGNTFYTGFQAGAATANTTYTWPLTSPASGTSVLQSDTSGTLSWVAAAAGGGGGAGTVASGTANQVAVYAATGASVSGAANFTYNTTSVTITNTTASNNNSSGALLVHGGIGASGQISGAGASFTSTVFLNGIQIGQGGNNININDSAGTTIANFNTSNGWFRSAQTTQSTSSGTGALVSLGGLGVAKAASIGETVYALSTVNSTSLTTGALVVSGGAGFAKTIFVGDNINIFKSGSVGALRLWNSANTFYTGLQAGAPSANTTYTLPIAFPGSGTSVLASDTSGIMSWIASGGGSGTVTTLTAGSGITFSTGTTITTTGTIRAKRPLVISFCTGYTPTASGADTNVIRIPDSPTDGTTALTYIPREFHIRVETPSAGTSTIQLEKYTGTSAFSGTAITSLSITGGAVYEVQSSVFAAAGLALTSGDKMRINFTALNATHANFSVTLELEEF
jgi:hypothetical protein